MAPTKRSVPAAKAGATKPDRPSRFMRGKRTQITLTVMPVLVERLDAAAARRFINRSALITLWLAEKLEQEPG